MLLRRFGALAGAMLLTFGIVASVSADAANPATINVQVNGTTVTLSGTWDWLSYKDSACTPTSKRIVGWAVDWGDPNDPGNRVGATQWYVGTATDNTVHTDLDCGAPDAQGVQSGTWGPISHTYTESGDYDVCVLMYDVHRRDGVIPATGRHSLVAAGPDRNTDNSAEENGLTPTGEQGGPCIPARFHISSIDIVKSADATSLPAGGGPVTFTYVVTNLGQGPLSDIVLVDDKCSPVTFVGGDANTDSKLDVTETWTFTCSKTITATEHNVAVVTGIDEEHDPPVEVSAQDDLTVEVADEVPTDPPAATPTPTPTPMPEGSVLAATGTPAATLPPTDSTPGGGGPSTLGLGIALMGLGLLSLAGSFAAPALSRRIAVIRD